MHNFAKSIEIKGTLRTEWVANLVDTVNTISTSIRPMATKFGK